MTMQQFIRVSRPPTLAATVVPMLVGGTSAWGAGFVWWAWLDMIAIGFAMQIGANMLNEYFDYVKGLDKKDTLGIGGIIVSGEVTPSRVRRWALGCYAVALILGLLLVVFRDPWLLLMGILAIVAGFVYAGGPVPISSTPWGEFVVFVIMGPLEVTATQLAASGHITPLAWVASLPVGFLAASILLGNNLRDRIKDGEYGRRTIPVVVGSSKGRQVLASVVAGAFVAVGLATVRHALPWSALLMWLALPLAFKSVRSLQVGEGLKRAVPTMGRLHILAGILLSLGIIWHV